MKVDTQEILALLGAKELEINLLRRQIDALTKLNQELQKLAGDATSNKKENEK